jgi:flagellar motility protein MotE (MotC chaperone)
MPFKLFQYILIGVLLSAQVAAEETSIPDFVTAEETPNVFMALNRERENLNEARQRLEEERAELEVFRTLVQSEYDLMMGLKSEIEDIFGKISRNQDDEILRLVSIFENMRPEEAANLLNDFDMSISIEVFQTMNERRSAPILARMTPVRAQAITRILVEISRLPEDQNLANIRVK